MLFFYLPSFNFIPRVNVHHANEILLLLYRLWNDKTETQKKKRRVYSKCDSFTQKKPMMIIILAFLGGGYLLCWFVMPRTFGVRGDATTAVTYVHFPAVSHSKKFWSIRREPRANLSRQGNAFKAAIFIYKLRKFIDEKIDRKCSEEHLFYVSHCDTA